jgi:hypothetical protein
MSLLKKLGIFFILAAGAPAFSSEGPSEEAKGETAQVEETIAQPNDMEQFPIISDQDQNHQNDAE